jgi:hypothetical protein
MTTCGNISYSIKENAYCEKDNVSYEEILENVNTLEEEIPEISYDYDMCDLIGFDDYIASELDYRTNYIKKDLERIVDYYGLSKRKKKKDDLIEDIVLFEKDTANTEKVYQRRKMWKYIEEIKKDKYLRQFLILD